MTSQRFCFYSRSISLIMSSMLPGELRRAVRLRLSRGRQSTKTCFKEDELELPCFALFEPRLDRSNKYMCAVAEDSRTLKVRTGNTVMDSSIVDTMAII